MQQLGQHLEMALDPPATPVGLAARRRRHRAGRFVISTISVSPSRVGSSSDQHDPPQAMDAVAVGVLDQDLAARRPRRCRSGRRRRKSPRARTAACSCAAGPGKRPTSRRSRRGTSGRRSCGRRSTAARPRRGPGRAGPAPGCGRPPRGSGRGPARWPARRRPATCRAGRPAGSSQGGDAVLGPGQDVAVEDPGRIAGDRLVEPAAGGVDRRAGPGGGVRGRRRR